MRPCQLLPLALTATLLGSGCAMVSQTELTSLRAHGANPELLQKLRGTRPLTPPEIIELWQHGAGETLLVRHIQDTGVDYLVNREDIRQLREARVGPRVIGALIEAGRDFAARYSPLPVDYGYYGPWYGGAWGGGVYIGRGYHHWR